MSSANVHATWNSVDLPPPINYAAEMEISPRVMKTSEQLYSLLVNASDTLFRLDCLHVEAALLSRFLYRFHRKMRRDRGMQFMKMVMQSLNKFLKLNLAENLSFVLSLVPKGNKGRKATLDFPTQATLSWLLTRIQGFASLFLRIFELCKEAGKFLFQRLRIGWSPILLMFGLCIVARIRVIARFLVLRSVRWYSTLIGFVKTFAKVSEDPHKNYPNDLKEWLGGLESLISKPLRFPKTRLAMVLDMIDLTEDDNETQIIRDFGPSHIEDEEIKTLYEMVTLDSSSGPLILTDSEEDIGEVVDINTFNANQSVEFVAEVQKSEGVPVFKQNVKLKSKKRKNKDNLSSQPTFKKSKIIPPILIDCESTVSENSQHINHVILDEEDLPGPSPRRLKNENRTHHTNVVEVIDIDDSAIKTSIIKKEKALRNIKLKGSAASKNKMVLKKKRKGKRKLGKKAIVATSNIWKVQTTKKMGKGKKQKKKSNRTIKPP